MEASNLSLTTNELITMYSATLQSLQSNTLSFKEDTMPNPIRQNDWLSEKCMSAAQATATETRRVPTNRDSSLTNLQHPVDRENSMQFFENATVRNRSFIFHIIAAPQ